MVALLERLAAQRTILLVEHKMKMILGLSDRILVLHHGQLIADSTPGGSRPTPRSAASIWGKVAMAETPLLEITG